MKVYIVHTTQDQSFVDKLTNDLRTRNVNVVAYLPTESHIEHDMVTTDVILVVLSEHLLEDDRLNQILDYAKTHHRQLIALRTGTIASIPQAVRGTLPVDFSNESDYEDSLLTLLEDLEPPTAKVSAVASDLPDGIEEQLLSTDTNARLAAIQKIADIHLSLDEKLKTYAIEQLGIVAFRDKNGAVKNMARSTIQLINQSLEPEINDDATDQFTPLEQIIEETTDYTTQPLSEKKNTKAKPSSTPRIDVKTPQAASEHQSVIIGGGWRLLPLAGIGIAILQAALLEKPLASLPIALVWLVLPWFNVMIRDGGRLDWKMPGAFIGNTAIGVILAILGGLVAVVVGNLNFAGLILVTLMGGIFGGLIGWWSSLFQRVT